MLSQVIFRGFGTVNPAVLHSCHSKDKGKTQGVQLPGPSGPKAPRTQGVKLTFFSDSRLALKFFKVVANSKKVGRHF